MAQFITVGDTGEYADGTMKEVVVEGREILIARIGGTFYAVDSRCPHLGGKLANGTLEGTVVTCPRHGSQFDITSGRVVRWLRGSGLTSALGKVFKAPKPLHTFKVKIEEGIIRIEV